MGDVKAEDVRDVINVTTTDIPDAKVLKIIKRAEVTLELELGTSIDYSNCTDAEKEVITLIAAIYALCFLTGGSAAGLNFSLGPLRVDVASDASPLVLLERLEKQVKDAIEKMRDVPFKVGQA